LFVVLPIELSEVESSGAFLLRIPEVPSRISHPSSINLPQPQSLYFLQNFLNLIFLNIFKPLRSPSSKVWAKW
jgi:hypothetical protein